LKLQGFILLRDERETDGKNIFSVKRAGMIVQIGTANGLKKRRKDLLSAFHLPFKNQRSPFLDITIRGFLKLIFTCRSAEIIHLPPVLVT
jgi:hypothetical protein